MADLNRDSCVEWKKEEEEFAIATKRLKSNKSAAALRAVSRLKEEELDLHSSEARVEKAADCMSPKNLRTRLHTTSAISKS